MISYHDEQELRIDSYLQNIKRQLPDYISYYFDYCKSSRNYSPKTTLAYARNILLFYKFLVKSNPSLNSCKDISLDYLGNLSPLDIQEFISEISVYNYKDEDFVEDFKKTPISGAKIVRNGASGKANKTASIKGLYKYFFGMGMIKNNPAAIITSPKLPKKEIIRLERSESSLLLTAMNNVVESQVNIDEKDKKLKEKFYLRDLTIITLLLGTGIRVSECVNLNMNDIIWNKKALRIIRKGGNEDIVYFNDDIENLLLQYIESPERVIPLVKLDISPEADTTALFISHRGSRLCVRSIERMVKKHIKGVGITDKNITPHKLRATFGTNSYRQNKDVYLTADLLGHSGLEVVKRYAEIDDEQRLKARDNVDWT